MHACMWRLCGCSTHPHTHTVMSRSDDRDMVIKCLQLGAVDYLIKPLRRNELQNIWTRVWWRRLLSDVVPPDTAMHHSAIAYSTDSKETYWCVLWEGGIVSCGAPPLCVSTTSIHIHTHPHSLEDTDPVSKEGSAPAGTGTGNNHNSRWVTTGDVCYCGRRSLVHHHPLHRDQLDVKTHHGSNNGNGSNGGSKNGHRGGSNGNGCSTSRNAVAGSGNAPALNAAAAYDPPTNNNGHGSNNGGVEGGGSGGDGGSGDNANVGNSGNNGTGNSTVQSQQKGELPGVADLSEVPTSRAPMLGKGDQIAQGDYRPKPSPTNGQLSGIKRAHADGGVRGEKIARVHEHKASPGGGAAVPAVAADAAMPDGPAQVLQGPFVAAVAPPASAAMHGNPAAAVPLYSWPAAVQGGGSAEQGSGGLSPPAQQAGTLL